MGEVHDFSSENVEPMGETAQEVGETADLFNAELMEEIREAERDLVEIDSQREELNARKKEIMARLENHGFDKGAVKAAMKYYRTPDDKRDRWDVSYLAARKALGVEFEDKLFAASVERQVQRSQGRRRSRSDPTER